MGDGQERGKAGQAPLEGAGDLDPLGRYLAGLSGGYKDVLALALKRLEGRRFLWRPARLARLLREKIAKVEDVAGALADDPARKLPLKTVPLRLAGGQPKAAAPLGSPLLAPRAAALMAAYGRKNGRELLELASRFRDEPVLGDLAAFVIASEYFLADRAVEHGTRLLADTDLSPASRRVVLEKLAVAQVKTGDYAGAKESWWAFAALAAPPDPDPRLLFADLFWASDPAAALDVLDAVEAERVRMSQAYTILHIMLRLQQRGVRATRAIQTRRPGFGAEPLIAEYNIARAEGGLVAAQEPLREYYAAHSLAAPRFERGEAIDVTAIASDLTVAEPGPVGPLVTVIVTAFNAEGTIAAALASLRHQSYRNIEIIVVDDASGDTTREIVAREMADDPRIRLLPNRGNIGTYLSRNRAMVQARGAFITFQDADDWSHPERIARQVALMTANPDVVLSKSSWLRMRPDGSIPLRRWTRGFSHLNPSSLFIRAEALPRLGYFDAVRADADFEYARRADLLFASGAIRTLSLPLSIGFLGDASLTGSGPTAINVESYSPVRTRYKAAWVDSYAARMVDGALPLPALPASYGYAVPSEMAVDLDGVDAWFSEGAETSEGSPRVWTDRPPFWFGISLISAQASKDWERTVAVFRNCLRAILAQDDPHFRVVVAGHERPEVPELNDPRVSFIVSDRAPAAKPSEFRADKMWKRRLIFHRMRAGGGGYFMPVDADDLVSNRLVSYIRAQGVKPGFVIQKGYALDWTARRLAMVPGAWSVPFERVCGTSAVVLLDPERIPMLHQTDVDDVVQALLGPHANWRLTAEEVGRPLEEIDWPAAVYVVNTAVNLSFQRQRAGGRAGQMLSNFARAEVGVTPEIAEEFALEWLLPEA
ncbi:glycosyltransferase family 2 protein [Sphingomonas sp. ID0503]|uniref:glycosyltransferase family 2 protein n=1 Tax=Sphingomonas sp. ID0503 TaxID=3399691 RepID=UPI003AFB0F36